MNQLQDAIALNGQLHLVHLEQQSIAHWLLWPSRTHLHNQHMLCMGSVVKNDRKRCQAHTHCSPRGIKSRWSWYCKADLQQHASNKQTHTEMETPPRCAKLEVRSTDKIVILKEGTVAHNSLCWAARRFRQMTELHPLLQHVLSMLCHLVHEDWARRHLKFCCCLV